MYNNISEVLSAIDNGGISMLSDIPDGFRNAEVLIHALEVLSPSGTRYDAEIMGRAYNGFTQEEKEAFIGALSDNEAWFAFDFEIDEETGETVFFENAVFDTEDEYELPDYDTAFDYVTEDEEDVIDGEIPEDFFEPEEPSGSGIDAPADETSDTAKKTGEAVGLPWFDGIEGNKPAGSDNPNQSEGSDTVKRIKDGDIKAFADIPADDLTDRNVLDAAFNTFAPESSDDLKALNDAYDKADPDTKAYIEKELDKTGDSRKVVITTSVDGNNEIVFRENNEQFDMSDIPDENYDAMAEEYMEYQASMEEQIQSYLNYDWNSFARADQDPMDQDPAERDPVNQDPVDQEPTDQVPADQDPIKQDPVDSETAGDTDREEAGKAAADTEEYAGTRIDPAIFNGTVYESIIEDAKNEPGKNVEVLNDNFTMLDSGLCIAENMRPGRHLGGDNPNEKQVAINEKNDRIKADIEKIRAEYPDFGKFLGFDTLLGRTRSYSATSKVEEFKVTPAKFYAGLANKDNYVKLINDKYLPETFKVTMYTSNEDRDISLGKELYNDLKGHGAAVKGESPIQLTVVSVKDSEGKVHRDIYLNDIEGRLLNEGLHIGPEIIPGAIPRDLDKKYTYIPALNRFSSAALYPISAEERAGKNGKGRITKSEAEANRNYLINSYDRSALTEKLSEIRTDLYEKIKADVLKKDAVEKDMEKDSVQAKADRQPVYDVLASARSILSSSLTVMKGRLDDLAAGYSKAVSDKDNEKAEELFNERAAVLKEYQDISLREDFSKLKVESNALKNGINAAETNLEKLAAKENIRNEIKDPTGIISKDGATPYNYDTLLSSRIGNDVTGGMPRSIYIPVSDYKESKMVTVDKADLDKWGKIVEKRVDEYNAKVDSEYNGNPAFKIYKDDETGKFYSFDGVQIKGEDFWTDHSSEGSITEKEFNDRYEPRMDKSGENATVETKTARAERIEKEAMYNGKTPQDIRVSLVESREPEGIEKRKPGVVDKIKDLVSKASDKNDTDGKDVDAGKDKADLDKSRPKEAEIVDKDSVRRDKRLPDANLKARYKVDGDVKLTDKQMTAVAKSIKGELKGLSKEEQAIRLEQATEKYIDKKIKPILTKINNLKEKNVQIERKYGIQQESYVSGILCVQNEYKIAELCKELQDRGLYVGEGSVLERKILSRELWQYGTMAENMIGGKIAGLVGMALANLHIIKPIEYEPEGKVDDVLEKSGIKPGQSVTADDPDKMDNGNGSDDVLQKDEVTDLDTEEHTPESATESATESVSEPVSEPDMIPEPDETLNEEGTETQDEDAYDEPVVLPWEDTDDNDPGTSDEAPNEEEDIDVNDTPEAETKEDKVEEYEETVPDNDPVDTEEYAEDKEEPDNLEKEMKNDTGNGRLDSEDADDADLEKPVIDEDSVSDETKNPDDTDNTRMVDKPEDKSDNTGKEEKASGKTDNEGIKGRFMDLIKSISNSISGKDSITDVIDRNKDMIEDPKAVKDAIGDIVKNGDLSGENGTALGEVFGHIMGALDYEGQDKIFDELQEALEEKGVDTEEMLKILNTASDVSVMESKNNTLNSVLDRIAAVVDGNDTIGEANRDSLVEKTDGLKDVIDRLSNTLKEHDIADDKAGKIEKSILEAWKENCADNDIGFEDLAEFNKTFFEQVDGLLTEEGYDRVDNEKAGSVDAGTDSADEAKAVSDKGNIEISGNDMDPVTGKDVADKLFNDGQTSDSASVEGMTESEMPDNTESDLTSASNDAFTDGGFDVPDTGSQTSDQLTTDPSVTDQSSTDQSATGTDPAEKISMPEMPEERGNTDDGIESNKDADASNQDLEVPVTHADGDTADTGLDSDTGMSDSNDSGDVSFAEGMARFDEPENGKFDIDLSGLKNDLDYLSGNDKVDADYDGMDTGFGGDDVDTGSGAE